MTITFISSNPAQNEINVGVFQAIELVFESTATFNLGTLNITIIQEGLNPKQAVINGVSSTNFTLTTVILPVLGGERLVATLYYTAGYNSHANVTVNYQISDGAAFSGTLNFRIIDINPPEYLSFSPSDGSTENGTLAPIFFQIKDPEGIDLSTLNVYVKSTVDGIEDVIGILENGIPIFGFSTSNGRETKITQSGDIYNILLFMVEEFRSGALITVESSVSDSFSSATILKSFSIIDIESPKIEPVIPLDGQIDVLETTTITFKIEDTGTGVDNTKVKVEVNGVSAIISGAPANDYSVSIVPSGQAEIYTLTPPVELASATKYYVNIEAADLRKNIERIQYSFSTRNSTGPRILDFLPRDGYADILPNFDISFKVKEDLLGHLQKLKVVVNNELALDLKQQSDFYDRIIYQDTEVDGYWNVVNRGFKTEIRTLGVSEYQILINPLKDYQFEELVSVNVQAEDDGYIAENVIYNFWVTNKNLTTTANPVGGKYKNFLDGENGVELVCNYNDCRIYYTTDGTIPKVDKFGIVQGTTKYYDGRKILLNSEGQHIIKFFSIDSAGTKEDTKQEVYIITPFPPEATIDKIVYLANDVSVSSRVIPVESTFSLKSGQNIRILDDIRSPVYTKIVSVNSTASPKYVTIEKEVEKLKIERRARIEIQEDKIDTTPAIDFDTTKLEEFFYIGSDSNEKNQADSIIEELRILNRASSTSEVEADYKILQKNRTFYCAEESVDLGREFSTLENQRANLADNTLVLLDFDGSIDNKGMLGKLKKDESPIIDKNVANNIILFTIKVKKDKFIDRELLKKVLRNFTPVDLEIVVEFEEVE